jgi:hypothetical protein
MQSTNRALSEFDAKVRQALRAQLRANQFGAPSRR